MMNKKVELGREYADRIQKLYKEGRPDLASDTWFALLAQFVWDLDALEGRTQVDVRVPDEDADHESVFKVVRASLNATEARWEEEGLDSDEWEDLTGDYLDDLMKFIPEHNKEFGYELSETEPTPQRRSVVEHRSVTLFIRKALLKPWRYTENPKSFVDTTVVDFQTRAIMSELRRIQHDLDTQGPTYDTAPIDDEENEE